MGSMVNASLEGLDLMQGLMLLAGRSAGSLISLPGPA
jgi:hypothetical protein